MPLTNSDLRDDETARLEKALEVFAGKQENQIGVDVTTKTGPPAMEGLTLEEAFWNTRKGR